MTVTLGRTGIWSRQLRYGDASEAAEAAAELEQLGYGALWMPDSGGELFADVDNLLTATQRITVATGILNIWLRPADESAARFHELTAAHGERLLMGIGVSHAHAIERLRGPGVYTRPVQQVAAFLDGLDAADPPVSSSDRVLAALGPRMVELARRRSAGAHPYLVTPEHTAITRERLGDRPVVAVEQGVVLEADRDAARALARQHLAFYLTAPNYTNNWKRIGFTDDDLAGGGSDRLVDALYARGDETAIARRVKDQRDAGASHVCVQVVTADPDAFPRAEWRVLAPALV
jgi:probable F420-dependent oxidoreductase